MTSVGDAKPAGAGQENAAGADGKTPAAAPVSAPGVVSGRETIKLSRPLTWEGREIKELVLDLDGLTGNDLATAEAEMQAAGVVPVMVDASKRFMLYVAARAAGVPVEVMMRIAAKDATKVTLAAQGFLMG